MAKCSALQSKQGVMMGDVLVTSRVGGSGKREVVWSVE